MIGSDIWKEKQCYCRPLRDARILSHAWLCLVSDAVRWKNGTVNTMQIFLFSHNAWWKARSNISIFLRVESELASDTWFFLLRGRRCSGLFNMFKVTSSESYVLLTTKSKDVTMMVQFISCTAWHHVYYSLLLWPLLVAAVKSVCRSP